jgi:hypothetical protein
MKFAHFVKTELKSITPILLKYFFIVFLKFADPPQPQPRSDTASLESQESVNTPVLTDFESLIMGVWCSELILNPIIIAKCTTAAYQYWNEFLVESFLLVKDIIIYNQYLLKRILFLLSFDRKTCLKNWILSKNSIKTANTTQKASKSQICKI